MSAKMLLLTKSLFQNLITAILAQSALPENGHRSATFFALWFHSPLAYNDYSSLLLVSTTQQPETSKKRPLIKQEQEDTKAGILSAPTQTGKKRIQIIELSEIAAQSQHTDTTIELVRLKGTQQHVHAVTTVAYDGKTQIGVDSLSRVYGAEQNVAIETLKDNMERRFAPSNQQGVVAKIAQTLLVLAMEPADLSLEFLLQQRFDTNIVVSNLLEIVEEQRSGQRVPLAALEMDEDVGEGDSAQMREFRSRVKRITVNLFGRFPELAIDCSESLDPALIKSVFSLWVAVKSLFSDTRTSLQGESARALYPRYREALESSLGDRSELLRAAVVSNIEGAGPKKWLLVRELFAMALMRAHLHVATLADNPNAPDAFNRAKHALFVTHAAVVQYKHSHSSGVYAKLNRTATMRELFKD